MTLADLRAQVAEGNRAIDRAGLVTLAFGNVSGVDRAAGVLAIKPSGLACATIEPERSRRGRPRRRPGARR